VVDHDEAQLRVCRFLPACDGADLLWRHAPAIIDLDGQAHELRERRVCPLPFVVRPLRGLLPTHAVDVGGVPEGTLRDLFCRLIRAENVTRYAAFRKFDRPKLSKRRLAHARASRHDNEVLATDALEYLRQLF